MTTEQIRADIIAWLEAQPEEWVPLASFIEAFSPKLTKRHGKSAMLILTSNGVVEKRVQYGSVDDAGRQKPVTHIRLVSKGSSVWSDAYDRVFEMARQVLRAPDLPEVRELALIEQRLQDREPYASGFSYKTQRDQLLAVLENNPYWLAWKLATVLEAKEATAKATERVKVNLVTGNSGELVRLLEDVKRHLMEHDAEYRHRTPDELYQRLNAFLGQP